MLFRSGHKYTVGPDGNIRFTVTSNGFTGDMWAKYFENIGMVVGGSTKNTLHVVKEAPTTIETYNVVVRPGKLLNDAARVVSRIREGGEFCGWKVPHWEVGCLLRDKLTEADLEQMGLAYIVVMHEPIACAYDGAPKLLILTVASFDPDYRQLHDSFATPARGYDEKGGFAFIEAPRPNYPKN